MRGGFRPVAGGRGRVIGAAAIILILGGLAASPPAQAADCLYPDRKTGSEPDYRCLKPAERAIVELRKFRAEITVAALRCNQQTAYNAFVTRHQGELSSRGKLLGAIFRRQYGTAATRELNRYVTFLTNQASIRSLGVRDYCRSMNKVFSNAMKTPLSGLLRFVSSNPLPRAEPKRR